MVVAARNKRWAEWAVFSAAYLIRLGHPVEIAHSATELASIYGSRSSSHPRRFPLSFWSAAQSLPHLTFANLDDYLDGHLSEAYCDLADEWANTIAAYDLKCEEFEPLDGATYDKAVLRAKRMLQNFGPAAERYLATLPGVRLICPSGLIGLTVALREAARRAGMEAVYVESWSMRPGHNVWNCNQPALDFDVDGWLEAMGPWTPDHEREYQKFIRFREGQVFPSDDWLKDFHQVQRTARDCPLPSGLETFLGGTRPVYLLGTNVIGDSATLRRATIFCSQREWVTEIIRFFQSRPELKLVIRVHPDEDWQCSKVRMGEIARQAAHGAPNVFVVDSHTRVNTFALMTRASAGLAWVSNFGLDMAIRGKPVLLAARAPYAHLGVCQSASSREDYFDRLSSLPTDSQPPDHSALVRAKAYHYILFKLMSLRADSDAYRGADYRLRNEPDTEREVFYRILAGELPEKYPALLSRRQMFITEGQRCGDSG